LPTRDRLTRPFLALVRACVVLNFVALGLALLVFVGSWVFAAPIEARLVAKYQGRVPVAETLGLVRFLLLLVLPAAWAIDRLFRALAAMLRTILDGEPFAAANAVRLRTIGWALLALQLIDLAMGAATWWASARGIDTVGWQPALTGWLAVLVAFVLARVFAAGTRLSEDVEGLV
jgi:hypothetical protein